MASKTPSPQPGPYDLSPEQAQALFGDINWDSGWESIPEWHVEILKERITQYCKTGVQFTPFEEFEKELFEMLRKG